MSEDKKLAELELRLRRIERELLLAEARLELALLEDAPKEILTDLVLDIDNIERKLRWFNLSLKKLQEANKK